MSDYFNDDILNEGIYSMANPSKNTFKDFGKVSDHFLKVKESDPKYIAQKMQDELERKRIERERIERSKQTSKKISDSLKKDSERIDLMSRNITQKDLDEFRSPINNDKWVKDSDPKSSNIPNKDNKPSANIPSAVMGPQTLKNKIETNINTIKADPKEFITKNKNVALGGVAGAAAVLGIGAIIANILKKRKWKLDGCNKIENPSKKQQCKNYIMKKNMSDIKSQCKYANNPEKCKRMAMEKLRDI